jgi:hypothetical protein
MNNNYPGTPLEFLIDNDISLSIIAKEATRGRNTGLQRQVINYVTILTILGG